MTEIIEQIKAMLKNEARLVPLTIQQQGILMQHVVEQEATIEELKRLLREINNLARLVEDL